MKMKLDGSAAADKPRAKLKRSGVPDVHDLCGKKGGEGTERADGETRMRDNTRWSDVATGPGVSTKRALAEAVSTLHTTPR